MYNSEETILRCIDSVQKECESLKKNYEIILVDDGSFDNTVKLVDKKKYKNTRIITQTNAGPSAARNNGIENAKGKYIALNDSDDVWVEGKLKKQIDYLEENLSVDLVCAEYGKVGKCKKSEELTIKKIVHHNIFSPQTAVFRNKVKKVIFPVEKKYSEDMYYVIDVLKEFKVVYLPILSTKSVKNKCAFGESGLSANLVKMEQGELRNIQYAYSLDKINYCEFVVDYVYSLLRFFRRVLISEFSNLAKNRKKR